MNISFENSHKLPSFQVLYKIEIPCFFMIAEIWENKKIAFVFQQRKALNKNV